MLYNLYSNDIVLPTGNLREARSGAKRANVIIVTKCPKSITEVEKKSVTNQLKPLPHQDVFFSSIVYSESVLNDNESMALTDLKDKTFTLVTGIANPKPLEDFLEYRGLKFEHLKFKDHHSFTTGDIMRLKKKNKILTTEKDYVRLLPYFKGENKLFYLPIEFQIDQSKLFEDSINAYLKISL